MYSRAVEADTTQNTDSKAYIAIKRKRETIKLIHGGGWL